MCLVEVDVVGLQSGEGGVDLLGDLRRRQAAEALKCHRAAQYAERLRLGSQWQDIGLVFCSGVGTSAPLQQLRQTPI